MGGGAFNPRPKERTRLIPLWVDVALGSAAGIVSASCAAPFILTVDRAVTENSAGKSALGPALLSGLKEFALRPHRLLTSLPFAMVAGVYGATYATANSIDAICERALDVDSESAGMVHGAVKLITVTAVNMGSGVAKDAAFARMFGAGGAKPPPVPMVSYGIFCFRDLLTISAAFTIPPLLTQALVSSGTMEEKRAASAAQLLSPIGMQIVLTPLHLLALNLYNQPGATPGERAKAVIPLCVGLATSAAAFSLLAPALVENFGERFGLQLATEFYLVFPIIGTLAVSQDGATRLMTRSPPSPRRCVGFRWCCFPCPWIGRPLN